LQARLLLDFSVVVSAFFAVANEVAIGGEQNALESALSHNSFFSGLHVGWQLTVLDQL
jgi:hypothetical protein